MEVNLRKTNLLGMKDVIINFDEVRRVLTVLNYEWMLLDGVTGKSTRKIGLACGRMEARKKRIHGGLWRCCWMWAEMF